MTVHDVVGKSALGVLGEAGSGGDHAVIEGEIGNGR
jgi:hypothetical protein